MREAHSDIGLRNEIATELMHATRRLMQRMSQSMEELHVGMGQIPVLKLLRDRGMLTQRQLAEEIRVTPATICGTIKRMERAGLVRRTTIESDARVSCVSLTEVGTACIRRVEEMIERPYRDMMAGFSDDECRLLCDFAHRIGKNLTRSLEGDGEELSDADR